MDKVVASAREAVADIPDGASLAVGGFGPCGVPHVLCQALLDAGPTDLSVVSNNCGYDDFGLGMLLVAKRIRHATVSYMMGGNEFERQFLAGEVEVELTPQGTLAERMRAGGSGIPAFFTSAGVGTQVAEGGLPRRYNADASVAEVSPPKETRTFGGRTFVLEAGLVTDYALVRAWRADRHGNLVYRASARQFSPLCAMSGRVTIAEVEELVEPGELDPDGIHTPGIFVQRVVPVGYAGKRIEQRRTRPATVPVERATPAGAGSESLPQ